MYEQVLHSRKLTMNKEKAEEFYTAQATKDCFSDIITTMTRGEIEALIVSVDMLGMKDIQELIGPTDPAVAKTEAPESMRAKFGVNKALNAIHLSNSSDSSRTEAAFFFPELASLQYDHSEEETTQRRVHLSEMMLKEPQNQYSLCLILPDVLEQHGEQIRNKIKAKGFDSLHLRKVHSTKAQAKSFLHITHKDDFCHQHLARCGGPNGF
eukprot:Clim_evm159s147 gene=Clim_evmTU159s147